MMKYTLPALCAALFLTSCAGVRVSDTQVAAVVTERPNAIYIQPFSVDGAEFVGDHAGGPGERPIRQSLAPAEFSNILKEELEKLAPARVLRPDEVATQGWLVQGSLDVVDAGNPVRRGVLPPQVNPAGQSRIVAHVRVIDLGSRSTASDDKDGSKLRRRGQVIYEFDVAGGSRLSGARGSIYAPGFGYSVPFDYRNAAERIRQALEPDPHRYGYRDSTTIR
jgi:hypothetical protein